MTIDTADAKRTASALRLLADADTWQRGRGRDGQPVWFIPSERTAGVFHIVSSKGCTCGDARHRGTVCKDQVAGALRAAQVRAERPRRTSPTTSTTRSVDGICRHFPGLAPSIRAVAYHMLERCIDERGESCAEYPSVAMSGTDDRGARRGLPRRAPRSSGW